MLTSAGPTPFSAVQPQGLYTTRTWTIKWVYYQSEILSRLEHLLKMSQLTFYPLKFFTSKHVGTISRIGKLNLFDELTHIDKTHSSWVYKINIDKDLITYKTNEFYRIFKLFVNCVVTFHSTLPLLAKCYFKFSLTC